MKTKSNTYRSAPIAQPVFVDQDTGEAMRELYLKLSIDAQLALLGLATEMHKRQAECSASR